MRLAIVAAGFTPTEADALRRAMAAWKRHGGLAKFHDKFVNGMLGRGYQPDFAEQCFQQISGFGEYGFPESHAASFAKLVYASAWIKRHHPAAFAACLLNSQPMGFYAPAQLVRDAREHGVTVRPVDVNASEWDCTLEYDTGCAAAEGREKRRWGVGGPALRLGFRQVKGMRQTDAERIVSARRSAGVFESLADMQESAQLETGTLDRLARADAFASMGLSRRPASWEALALSNKPLPLWDGRGEPDGPKVALPVMPPADEVLADYATAGLSLKRHPVSFARQDLGREKVITAAALQEARRFPHGAKVSVAGLVLVRQRPGTASGVVFITLEDETGVVNIIAWAAIYERYRRVARHATLLQVTGTVQRDGQVIHVLARRMFDRTAMIPGVLQASRDFH